MQITVTAYAAIVAAGLPVPEGATIVPDTALVSAPMTLDDPATVALDREIQAELARQDDAQDAPALKVLTRSAWKSLRTTRNGKVRKAFAGLTREQALEAGLLPGYVMPTGAMREALRNA